MEICGMTSFPILIFNSYSLSLAKIAMLIFCLTLSLAKILCFQCLSPKLNQNYIIRKNHAIKDNLLYVPGKHI